MTAFDNEIWKKCGMPSLEHLSLSNSLLLSLDIYFYGGGPRDKKTFNLLINYIRLVDAVIFEYEETRKTWTRNDRCQKTGHYRTPIYFGHYGGHYGMGTMGHPSI